MSAATPSIYKNAGLLFSTSCLERPFSLSLGCLFSVIAISVPLVVPSASRSPLFRRSFIAHCTPRVPGLIFGWLLLFPSVVCLSDGDNKEKHTYCSRRHTLTCRCGFVCTQNKGIDGCYQTDVTLCHIKTGWDADTSKQVIHSGIDSERSLFNSLFNMCLSFHEHISKTIYGDIAPLYEKAENRSYSIPEQHYDSAPARDLLSMWCRNDYHRNNIILGKGIHAKRRKLIAQGERISLAKIACTLWKAFTNCSRSRLGLDVGVRLPRDGVLLLGTVFFFLLSWWGGVQKNVVGFTHTAGQWWSVSC